MTQQMAEPWSAAVGATRLEGLSWGDPQADLKIVALHGWQDNAASFLPLDNAVSCHPQWSVQLIAVDLPGHGLSDPFPLTQGYSLWDYAQSLIFWLHGLNQPVWFLGHSLGGMIAQIICAACPDQVRGLITLDILSVSIDPTGQLSVERLLEVLRTLTRPDQSMRSSPDFADAIRRRARIGSPASWQANELLAQRGFQSLHTGWVPRLDPRVKAGGFMRLTAEAADVLMQQVQCPWHAILAEQGITSEKRQQTARLVQPLLHIHKWSGGHHFHMEERPAELLTLIREIVAGE
jgi:pimeloyl-ACP methyl ester carboxylesterase